MSSIQFEKKETTMRVYSLFLPDDHNDSYASTERRQLFQPAIKVFGMIMIKL